MQVLQILRLNFVNSESWRGCRLLSGAVHPRCDGGPGVLFEGGAEGAVAVETTLERQLLGGKFTPVGHRLFIEADKVADAKPVDVSVISDALLGKVLAKIGPVCADGIIRYINNFA